MLLLLCAGYIFVETREESARRPKLLVCRDPFAPSRPARHRLSISLYARQDGLDWIPSSTANAKHKQLQDGITQLVRHYCTCGPTRPATLARHRVILHPRTHQTHTMHAMPPPSSHPAPLLRAPRLSAAGAAPSRTRRRRRPRRTCTTRARSTTRSSTSTQAPTRTRSRPSSASAGVRCRRARLGLRVDTSLPARPPPAPRALFFHPHSTLRREPWSCP